MKRLLILLSLLAVVAIAAPKRPERLAFASAGVSDSWRQREPVHTVQIPRGSNCDFALQANISGVSARMLVHTATAVSAVQAKINGIAAPMVVDTAATSVVLTYDTAKAVGLPLEMLYYNVD